MAKPDLTFTVTLNGVMATKYFAEALNEINDIAHNAITNVEATPEMSYLAGLAKIQSVCKKYKEVEIYVQPGRCQESNQ